MENGYCTKWKGKMKTRWRKRRRRRKKNGRKEKEVQKKFWDPITLCDPPFLWWWVAPFWPTSGLWLSNSPVPKCAKQYQNVPNQSVPKCAKKYQDVPRCSKKFQTLRAFWDSIWGQPVWRLKGIKTKPRGSWLISLSFIVNSSKNNKWWTQVLYATVRVGQEGSKGV